MNNHDLITRTWEKYQKAQKNELLDIIEANQYTFDLCNEWAEALKNAIEAGSY